MRAKFKHFKEGEKRTTPSGYIQVKNYTHPNCTKWGWVYEHRLVMEAHIARLLLRSEVIHHKNKIKTDNRINNLQLLSGHSEHSKLHPKEKSNRSCTRCNQKHFGLGLCVKHYNEQRRASGLDKIPCSDCGKLINGSPYKTIDGLRKCRRCRWPESTCKLCDRKAAAKGLCKRHYAGSIGRIKCSVCGKEIRKHGRNVLPAKCWSCTYPNSRTTINK